MFEAQNRPTAVRRWKSWEADQGLIDTAIKFMRDLGVHTQMLTCGDYRLLTMTAVLEQPLELANMLLDIQFAVCKSHRETELATLALAVMVKRNEALEAELVKERGRHGPPPDPAR